MARMASRAGEERLWVILAAVENHDHCFEREPICPESRITVKDPVSEGKLVVDAAAQHGITLRMIGGAAVQHLCPSARSAAFERQLHDLDLVGLSSQSAAISDLLERLAYLPNRRFNTLHGHTRLSFLSATNRFVVDVFLDQLMMCHNLDFRRRLHILDKTVSLTDLVLSKIQMIQIAVKDMRDVLCIFQDYPVCNTDQEGINRDYIARVLGSDWGFWNTVRLNLTQVEQYAREELNPTDLRLALDRLQRVRRSLLTCPKTLRWRLRSVIGERMVWYDIPEELPRPDEIVERDV